MDHFPGNWGRPKAESEGYSYSMPPSMIDGEGMNSMMQPKGLAGPTTRTQQPVVTGTSVLGVKYKDGIVLAADTLASYGSLAQIRDMKRLATFGDHTVIGASGDMSDWQQIQFMLNQQMIGEYCHDDGHTLHPKHIYEFMARVMYHRRSQQNPLWNSLVVGGFKNGEHFLGYVDLLGTTYQSSTIATGYGAFIAQPLLRKAVEGHETTLTEEDAIKIVDDALRVLFYRDARSLNKFQRAVINNAGARISEPYSLDTEWGFAENIRGYGAVYQ